MPAKRASAGDCDPTRSLRDDHDRRHQQWKTAFAGKSKAPAKQKKSKLAGKKAAVKYRDAKGNKWVGRGLAPKWLKAAEKAGQKRDTFLV